MSKTLKSIHFNEQMCYNRRRRSKSNMRRNNQDYSMTEEKYEIIKKHIEKIDKIKNDLQKHINFEIPEYIIHDIAENEEFNHICLIINVAIVNNRLSSENGNYLKEKIKSLCNIQNDYDRVCWNI